MWRAALDHCVHDGRAPRIRDEFFGRVSPADGGILRRLASRRRTLLIVLALTTALALFGTSTVFAALIGRDGKAVTAVRTVIETSFHNTTSTSFSNVPSMTKGTVSVPSGQRGLLIITFSSVTRCADAGASATVWCFVRVLVDGNPAPPRES